MTKLLFLIIFFLLNILNINSEANSDQDSTTENSVIYSTPSILEKTKFMEYVKNQDINSVYEDLLAEYNRTFVTLQGKVDEQKLKYELFKNETDKKLLPFRLCCEPQFVRYYINYGKELTGVRRTNVLFFLEEHRQEWIEKIINNTGKQNFGGRLEQAISRDGITPEEFVNHTSLMEMRASVAIHFYLSRTVRPLINREKFSINRFLMTKNHGRVFNILAFAMKTPNISVTDDGVVQVKACDEILRLPSDEIKIILDGMNE